VVKTTPREFLIFAALCTVAERFGSMTHVIGPSTRGTCCDVSAGVRYCLRWLCDGEPLALEFYNRVVAFCCRDRQPRSTSASRRRRC
jgi:hypothetical protein